MNLKLRSLLYSFLFIFFCSCTKSENDSQLLNSHYSEHIYDQVERIFTSNSGHPDNLVKFIYQKIIPTLTTGKTFLDIGAGPAYITQMISKPFSSISVIEPNRKYMQLYKREGYNTYLDNFQDITLDKKFHFILCSHVLYHVEHSEWPFFLRKMKNSIKKGGKAMLVLVAPRGKFNDFRVLINPNLSEHSSSGLVKKTLKELKIPFSEFPSIYTFRTKNYKDFYIVIELFTVTDCYTPEIFDKLPIHKKNKIYSEIQRFCKSCKNENGEYELVIEDDFLVFNT